MRKLILIISTLSALLTPLITRAQTNYGLSNLSFDFMETNWNEPLGVEKFTALVYFIFSACLIGTIILVITNLLRSNKLGGDVNLNTRKIIKIFQKIGVGTFIILTIFFIYFVIQIQPALYIRPGMVSSYFDHLALWVCLFLFGIGLVMTLWGLLQRVEFRRDPIKVNKAKHLFIRRGLVIMSLLVTYFLILSAISAFILQYYISGPEF